MTEQLTTLEFKAIEGIINSDYRDGYHPVGHPVWTWSANPFPSKQTFSGVVSSLAKKGLVTSTDEGKDSVIVLTQAGYDAFLATGGKAPKGFETEEGA